MHTHPRHFPFPLPGSYLPCRIVAHVAGVLAAALVFVSAVHADWPGDGVVLCSACRARGSLIASDAAGGAFVVWTDDRNGVGSNEDIFLQRVTASGTIAPGWPPDGLAVCLAPGIQGTDGDRSIAPDGSGGVIVAWRDYRNDAPGGTSADIYAQRVLSSGSLAPGWPADGVQVTLAPADQVLPVVLADGNGGAFVTWDDEYASPPDVYVQHLAPDGTVAPGWPPGGFPACTAAGLQGVPHLAPDGAGGILIAWADRRDGSIAQYAQRVMASGQLYPGWPENGIRIVTNRYMRDLVPDGVGGAYLSCTTAGGGLDGTYYLQRFTGAGAIVTGWPDGGALVCQAPDGRVFLRTVADGAGGALLVWSDYRDHFDDDVYALRMRSDGTRDPRWPLNGLPVTDNTALDDYTDLAPDGQGGAYLCWDQYSFATGDRVMIQHLTGAGIVAAGWPMGGLAVPSQVVNAVPHIVEDGTGGAIVTWTDYYERARALRIAADGPVLVAVSLVSAEAEPGRVRLTWYAPDAASLVATVERRTPTDDWQRQAEIGPNGTGRLEYEDRSVAPGARYGYRLAYRDADALLYTTETWVEVPKPAFVLRGLTPNPCLGDAVVAFSLPSGEPATLELFDLTGRQLLTREVGSLGAGTHRLNLGTAGRFPAGVYSIRLVQGTRRASARGVVVR